MTDAANTPGIYYGFSYVLGIVFMEMAHKKKTTALKTLLVTLMGAAVILPVILSTDGMLPLFFPAEISYVLTIWFCLGTVLRGGWRKALFLSFRAFISSEFAASLGWQIYYYVNRKHLISDGTAVMVGVLAGSHIACFFLLFYLEKRLVERTGTLEISSRNLANAGLICLTVYLVSNTSYVFGNSFFGSQHNHEIFLIRTLVDFAGILLLFTYHLQLGEVSMTLEMARLKDIIKTQYDNYEVLSESMEMVNIKYHDLKHQIAILREGGSGGDSMEYLDRMEEEIKGFEAMNKTGNEVIDTILTAKTIYAQNHWIELTSVVDGEALSFMDKMDLAALFGNLLSNAIESVEKIDHKERRLIHLAVAKEKGFVRIRLENCYDKPPEIEEGLIKTTKENKAYHGYGMKSIAMITKKYGGSVTVNAQKGWFEQRILIPLPAIK